MAPGLDDHQIVNGATVSSKPTSPNAFVNSRIYVQAIVGGSGFDSIADDILLPVTHGTLRALIEPKLLCLFEKRHTMRALAAERLIQGTFPPQPYRL